VRRLDAALGCSPPSKAAPYRRTPNLHPLLFVDPVLVIVLDRGVTVTARMSAKPETTCPIRIGTPSRLPSIADGNRAPAAGRGIPPVLPACRPTRTVSVRLQTVRPGR